VSLYRLGLPAHGTRRALAAAAIAVALCATVLLAACGVTARVVPSPPAANPLPLAGTVTPGAGTFLGAYAPPAPFDVSALDAFEAKAGKSVAIVMWFQPWAPDNRNQVDLGTCAAILERGAVPLITWEPWDPGSNANTVKDPGINADYRLAGIVAGAHDAYLRTWARAIKRLGGPVMLRPMHEMNGDWYPWCGTVNGNKPQEFTAAWRHIHDIFIEEGATNVTWVWSINHESVPSTKVNTAAVYYPGDGYVDWTSISGFNWGTSSPVSSWRTWSYVYAAPLAYLHTLNKPVCISEMACVEQGGNKAAWIADAYSRIAKDPDIRAVVYYSAIESGGPSTQDWRIDSTAASASAFAKAIAPTTFSPGPVAALAQWKAQLGTTNTSVLTGFEKLY